MSATTKQTIKLKKLTKYNTTWHPESTLVFKSPGTGKDKVVIGRWINEELVSLDEEAVTLCETWNFKPDPELMAEESEGDDQSEENSTSPEGEAEEETPEAEEETPEAEDDSPEAEEETPEVEEQPPVEEKPKKNIVAKDSVEEPNGGGDIKEPLVAFEGEINNLTKGLTKALVPIFANLENRIAELESALAEKTRANEELESKYNAINQKFVAMKSLFN